MNAAAGPAELTQTILGAVPDVIFGLEPEDALGRAIDALLPGVGVAEVARFETQACRRRAPRPRPACVMPRWCATSPSSA